MKNFISLYYLVKPLIPRKIQIFVRRMSVRGKLQHYSDVWPIDHKAKTPPVEWTGWPDDKKFSLILTHDVDTAKGQDNCLQLAEMEMDIGFRSSFNFVPRRYNVKSNIREYLMAKSFEVGVHGLYHDGKYYTSYEVFCNRAMQINKYIRDWNAVGFRSPSMLHNLEWIHHLDIEYDASTFDTDPFEPQSDGVGTIFPFWVFESSGKKGYVELPYTLPQDFTQFILMKKTNIDIWKIKLDWIAKNGGMALINTHPDYMSFNGKRLQLEEYPAEYYKEFLEYVMQKYKGEFWHVLPKDISRFWKKRYEIEKR